LYRLETESWTSGRSRPSGISEIRRREHRAFHARSVRRVDDNGFGLCRPAFADSHSWSRPNSNTCSNAKTVANSGAGAATGPGPVASTGATHRKRDACVANGNGRG